MTCKPDIFRDVERQGRRKTRLPCLSVQKPVESDGIVESYVVGHLVMIVSEAVVYNAETVLDGVFMDVKKGGGLSDAAAGVQHIGPGCSHGVPVLGGGGKSV